MERITSIDELIQFLERNYDRITDKEYQNILRSTLSVYVGNKSNKDDAIRLIREHYDFIQTIPKGYELPLFLNVV